MKPVFQSIIDAQRGDCQTACFASILELPLEDVPSFCALAVDAGKGHPVVESWNHIHRWVNGFGFSYLQINPKHLGDWRGLLGQYAILSMPSQKYSGSRHAVVGQWQHDPDSQFADALYLRVVHDPNPTNAPYAADVEPIMVAFLIPKNPAA